MRFPSRILVWCALLFKPGDEIRRKREVNPIVETTCGKLEGSEENDLFVFRGIPYAAAPNGALRWCAPVEPPAWKGVRPARAFGPACPQPSLEEQYGSVMAIGATDEDCLYLNVWSPALQDGGARPVMVYIHGGGFRIGAGSLAHYDGSALARRGDVVVVTINYRLGPFGFFHLDGPTQGAVPATGNEGLLDVVAALRWVQANIDTFGGDPANVTIFGQSAGGMSVAALMTMTAATGLYHKAIVQSAPGALTFDRDQASALGTKLIEDLGVAATDSEALRTAGTDRILEAGLGVLDLSNPDPAQRRPFPRPVLDGEVLTRPVLDAVAAGSAAGVPLLAGTTRDEMSLPLPEGATMDDLPSFLEHRLPAGIDLVALVAAFEKARGARGASISPSDVAAALVTEFGLRVPTTRLLDAQRQHQSAVYHYVFSWCSPTGDGRVKARHHTDTGILFGTHDVDDQHAEMFGQGPAADALAAAMQDAWAAFARTGNPSSSTLGDWPVYGEDRSTMFIGERTHVVQAPYEAERQALAAVSNELICSVQ